MPPWAPAGPPLLHGSRDNLNWSMCHCNLPIPPAPHHHHHHPNSIPANCHTGVHKHCCPSAGQNTGQGPSLLLRPHSEKYILVVNSFIFCVCECVCFRKANIAKSSFLSPSLSFKVVNSIFNSTAVNENEIL